MAQKARLRYFWTYWTLYRHNRRNNDRQNLELGLEADGKPDQHCYTSKMIFQVKQLISYVSQLMNSPTGDIIATSTPAGVELSMDPNPFFSKTEHKIRLGIAT